MVYSHDKTVWRSLPYHSRSIMDSTLAMDVTKATIIGYKYSMTFRIHIRVTLKALAGVFLVFLLAASLGSCSKSIGWGVVLRSEERRVG